MTLAGRRTIINRMAAAGEQWLEELVSIVEAAACLPPPARASVVAVIEAFAREDGRLPARAAVARTSLLGDDAAEPIIRARLRRIRQAA